MLWASLRLMASLQCDKERNGSDSESVQLINCESNGDERDVLLFNLIRRIQKNRRQGGGGTEAANRRRARHEITVALSRCPSFGNRPHDLSRSFASLLSNVPANRTVPRRFVRGVKQANKPLI